MILLNLCMFAGVFIFVSTDLVLVFACLLFRILLHLQID